MKSFVFLAVLFLSHFCLCQISMLTEFRAMPAFPIGAKEAFKVSKIEVVDANVSYVSYSDAIAAYAAKLKADQQPYADVNLAKAKATDPAAQGIANDFSDLNSPETQAKIAKMTQEEKVKFAMEVQARIAANKNNQTIQSVNKPSPLTALSLKVNQSGHALLASLMDFQPTAFPVYDKCIGICKESNPLCPQMIKNCESKISHDHYNAEVTAYAKFIKEEQIQFDIKKTDFENNLKEFDTAASKYTKQDIASDFSGIFVILGEIAGKLAEYEHQGAMIIVNAKNDSYCKKDF